MHNAERSFKNLHDLLNPGLSTSKIQRSAQQSGTMQASSWTQHRWNPQSSRDGSKPAPSYSGHHLVLTGPGTKENACNYVGMNYSQLQYNAPLPTVQGSTWSGSVANASHCYSLPAYVQASPLSFNSTSVPGSTRQTAALLNSINRTPVPRNTHCVGSSYQNMQHSPAMVWTPSETLAVLPARPSPQMSGLTNGAQNLSFSSGAAAVSQRPLQNTGFGNSMEKTVHQSQVPITNSFYGSMEGQSGRPCVQRNACMVPGYMNLSQKAESTQRRSLDTPATGGSPYGTGQNVSAKYLKSATDRTFRIANMDQANSQKVTSCAQEMVNMASMVNWRQGQNSSVAPSLQGQSTSAQNMPSVLEGTSGNSLEQPQKTHARQCIAKCDASIHKMLLKDLLTTEGCIENAAVHMSRVEGYRAANCNNAVVPGSPLLCSNPILSSTVGCNGTVGAQYSGRDYLRNSSGTTEQPHHNLSRTVDGGSLPQSSGVTQQHADVLSTVSSWPSVPVQPSKPADAEFHGMGIGCQNALPHKWQNQELSYNRNKHYGHAAHGRGCTGSNHGVCCTSNQPKTSAKGSDHDSQAHVLHSSYGQPSSLPNRVGQSISQPCSEKSFDSHQQRKGYFVTVAEDMQGNGFTAEKVIFMGNDPPDYAQTMDRIEMLSTGKTAEVNGGRTSLGGLSTGKTAEADGGRTTLGRFSSTNDPEKKALAPAAEASCAAGRLHSSNSQHNTHSVAAVQRAVAVVPPIPLQPNSDHKSEILNADELELKIKNVWSLLDKGISNNPEGEINNPSLSQTKTNVSSTTQPDKMVSNEKCVTNTTSETQTLSALAVAHPALSNQQLLESEEKSSVSTGCDTEVSNLDFKSEVEPSVSNENDGDKELHKNEGVFDLSTVPVIVWTADGICNLIAELENTSRLCEPKVHENPTSQIMRLFWGGDVRNFYSAIRTKNYKEFFSFWSVPADRTSVIFSQVSPMFNKKLEEECHIFGQDITVLNETVYKSSWLNVNEQIDDIDKECGFPLCLRAGIQTPEEVSMETGSNETEKDKMPDTLPENTNVDLPPEGALPESENSAPSAEVCDPLSLLKISVLTSEEARAFFCAESSKSGLEEEIQSEVPGNKSEAAKVDLVPEYCCISRWVEVIGGYESSSFCKCKSGSCPEKLEASAAATEGIKKDNMCTKRHVQPRCSPAPEPNGTRTQKSKLVVEELQVENGAIVDSQNPVKAVVVRQVCSDIDSCNNEREGKGNETSKEPCSGRVGDEAVLEFKTQFCVAGRSDVIEVRVEDAYEDCEMALLEAAAVSEQLWSKRMCVPQTSNIKESSSGEYVTKDVRLGNAETTRSKEPPVSRQQTPMVESLLDTSAETASLSIEPKFRNFFCRLEKNMDMMENAERQCGEKQTLRSELPLQRNLNQNIKGILSPSGTKDNVSQRSNKPLKKLKHKLKHGKKSLSASAGPITLAVKDGKINEDVAKKQLMKEMMQKEELQESKGSTVSLALYGSSPQRQKGVVSSSGGWSDNRHRSLHAHSERQIDPPKTISLHLPSQEGKFSAGNGAARQRVYNSWQKSLVLGKGRNVKLRFLTTVQNSRDKKGLLKNGKEDNAVKNRKTNGLSSLSGAGIQFHVSSGLSSQNEHVAALKNANEHKKSAHGAGPRDVCSGAVERKGRLLVESRAASSSQSKCSLPTRKKERNAPQSKLRSRSKAQPAVSGDRKSESRTKYEKGNPALMPLARTDGTLDYKVLPESFGFQQRQDPSLTEKSPRTDKNVQSPEASDDKARKRKLATWDLKDRWSGSPKKKTTTTRNEERCGEASLSITSPATQSHIAYEHYKRRYLSKLKK